MKRIAFSFFFIGIIIFAQAQKSDGKNKAGFFYFALGTHKAIYSKSDIYLKSTSDPAFDFTLKKVRAKDDFFLKGTGGAPQYDYQIGYYSKKKNLGIEFNFDHVKYFVRQNQTVHLTGTIEGEKYNRDTMITPGFFQFEHSDGANYVLINLVKMKTLCSKKDHNAVDLIMKAGAGPVIPKTNSRIMGKHWDDKYHVAGYVIAAEAGLRYNFSKNFFISPAIKGAFANYTDFLIAGGHGNQSWFSGQIIFTAGVRL